jgi:sigma-B regulation protein RsbU (phosphoserine phosphatase)
MARELQQSILPSAAPAVPGIDVASVYRPSSEVGGDFYDFYVVEEGVLLACIADASGHGLDSSMVSSMAKSALYLQVSAGRPLDLAMADINRMMCDTLGRRRLMTMTLLAIDAARCVVRWVNAGHCYPLLLRQGQVRELSQPSYPLGVRRETEYAVLEAALLPGDLLLLFTDGLLEAYSPQGEAYGWERLCACLAAAPAAPLAAIDALLVDVGRHLGSVAPQDDVTLVAIGFTGGSS